MLTVPLVIAAMTAGLFGGLHCVGMCGGLSILLGKLTKPEKNIIPIAIARENFIVKSSAIPSYHTLALHAGRLTTYGLIGAAFGIFGNFVVSMQGITPIKGIWHILGNLALLLLGLQLLGIRLSILVKEILASQINRFITCIKTSRVTKFASKNPFALGLAWGLLPCGLIMGIAPLAIFSGGALSGACLMLIFGLCALPHLASIQYLSSFAKAKSTMLRSIRTLCGIVIITMAILGLFQKLLPTSLAALCLS